MILLVLIPVVVIRGSLVNRDPLGKTPLKERGLVTGRIENKKRWKTGFEIGRASGRERV